MDKKYIYNSTAELVAERIASILSKHRYSVAIKRNNGVYQIFDSLLSYVGEYEVFDGASGVIFFKMDINGFVYCPSSPYHDERLQFGKKNSIHENQRLASFLVSLDENLTVLTK